MATKVLIEFYFDTKKIEIENSVIFLSDQLNEHMINVFQKLKGAKGASCYTLPFNQRTASLLMIEIQNYYEAKDK